MAVLKKLMLIANPVSGKKAVGNSLGDVCRIFLENGWATSVFITGQRGDATQFVKEYGDGFDRGGFRLRALGGCYRDYAANCRSANRLRAN